MESLPIFEDYVSNSIRIRGLLGTSLQTVLEPRQMKVPVAVTNGDRPEWVTIHEGCCSTTAVLFATMAWRFGTSNVYCMQNVALALARWAQKLDDVAHSNMVLRFYNCPRGLCEGV